MTASTTHPQPSIPTTPKRARALALAAAALVLAGGLASNSGRQPNVRPEDVVPATAPASVSPPPVTSVTEQVGGGPNLGPLRAD